MGCPSCVNLHGQRLYGYVDGTTISPPAYILSPEADSLETEPKEIPNPKYASWYDQDQIVLSTLVSLLSEGILAQMVGITTSREVWPANMQNGDMLWMMNFQL